ncbi:MAG: division/cell wall cluster transcriptional repressor MraZ [Flavobacterium sp.]
MHTFIGTYEVRLDPKGRVLVPSVLKKQMGDAADEGFVVKRSPFQKCLEIYTIKDWQETISGFSKLNRYIKENSDFIRQFTSGLKMTEFDSMGRILIAKDLQIFAGLDKDMVLNCNMNVIEIWDKEAYEKAVSIDYEDFGKKTEEILGKFYENGTDVS